MPVCQIEEYADSQQARAELIPWLVATDTEYLNAETWQKRLAHWWDDNPFAAKVTLRGWILRYDGNIVGFMGLIPTCYAVCGQATPAFIASTWRVDENHRNASISMLVKLRNLAKTTLIADTTPTPQVRALLQRSGWISLPNIQRRFVPLGIFQKLTLRRRWPTLPPGKRVTRDPGDVQNITAQCMSSASIEKWITPDYLQWFASSPKRRHEFVGVIDDAGCLSSYLFLTSKPIRGIPAWMEIDHFTTATSFDELHALVGELVRCPSLLGSKRLLSLAAFPGDSAWNEAPVVHQRTEHVPHFFAIPEALKLIPKRTVLAEGDWGI